MTMLHLPLCRPLLACVTSHLLPRAHVRAAPVTAALAALLLTLALLTVYLPTATANHHSCTWVGPGDNPTNAGWWFWCTATKKNEEPGKADYICSAGGQKVADYGRFATGILEFATPCNGGGFAPKSQCHESAYWGICLGDEDDNQNYPGGCRYMNNFDDCSWDKPNVTMPDKVNVYRSQAGSFVSRQLLPSKTSWTKKGIEGRLKS